MDQAEKKNESLKVKQAGKVKQLNECLRQEQVQVKISKRPRQVEHVGHVVWKPSPDCSTTALPRGCCGCLNQRYFQVLFLQYSSHSLSLFSEAEYFP